MPTFASTFTQIKANGFGSACVASSDEKYQKSTFSNYGPNVMIIPPGTNITAASNKADNQL
ncbi:hypothetical protein NHQ30_002576 [Ciborinia camelliae]|nr:hypothetical protein NHQ30_002576 [Ciborinia camelliae]